MVLVKIAMVGVAFIVLMGVAQSKQWPQRAGVVGRCAATGPLGPDPGRAWYSCKQGILTGFPNLEADSCRRVGIVAHREIWRCSATLESLPGY